MNEPTVSVVLPTYNRSEVIERAINSVIDQSYDDFELIVVDDNSTDDTVHIVDSVGDSRINIVEHSNNRGANVARNTGIRESSGEYIAFIDSDDEWMSNKLQRQIDVFSNSADETGAVYTGTKIITDKNDKIGNVPSYQGDIFKQELLSDRVSPTSAVMVKKECFEKVGLFDKSLPARQDYDMWLRISEQYRFEYAEEPLVKIYQQRQDRISRGIEKRIKAEKKLYKKKESRYSSSHDWDKIRAHHQFSIARHAYISNEYKISRKFCMAAIQIYPQLIMAWVILALSIFGISSSNNIVVHMRELIKK